MKTFILRRPLVINTVLVIISLLGVTVILEIGFRIYISIYNPDISQTIQKFQQWSQRDDTQLRFEPHPYLSYAPTSIRYGKNGITIRDRFFSQRKPQQVVRIACLGGSTTMLKYPVFLQEYLNQWKGDFQFEVMDFGCNGWNLMESTVNYLIRVSDFKPDIVILHHAANETPPRRWPGFHPDYSHFRKSWQQKGFMANHRRFVSFSWLASYFMWRCNLFAFDIQNLTIISIDRNELLDTLPFDSIEVIARNIKNLSALIESHGGKLLIAPLPHYREREIPLVTQSIEEFNDCSRRLAAEGGLPIAETDPLMQQHVEWFKDWVHVTREGDYLKSQVYAMVIWDILGLYKDKVRGTALTQFGRRESVMPIGRDLELFWDFDGAPVSKYSIFVRMDDEIKFQYLAETTEKTFRWKAGSADDSQYFSELFQKGPQFGVKYYFKVIALDAGAIDKPHIIGRLTSNKDVKIIERPLRDVP